MTQDERNMLADLANKFAQTPTPPKDPDAEDFIRKNIGARPDALYLMTQTVLIQNMALQQSQRQLQEMQQRLSQPAPTSQGGLGGGSFLGGQSAPQQPQYQYAPAPAPQYAPAPSGTSSFLRNAAQTAAGVAAGTLAVQGIESLFSHHDGFGGGFGGGMFGGGGVGGYGGGGETVIENNYYGDSDGGQNDRFADSRDNDISNSNDVQDSLQDTSFDDSSALGDDSNYDDSTGSDDNFS